MAYKKERKEAQRPEYQPLDWVQTSGDVDKDARFICTLSKRQHRLHELWRLEHFHGARHRAAVEARVMQLWPSRDRIKLEMNVCETWEQVGALVKQFFEKGTQHEQAAH